MPSNGLTYGQFRVKMKEVALGFAWTRLLIFFSGLSEIRANMIPLSGRGQRVFGYLCVLFFGVGFIPHDLFAQTSTRVEANQQDRQAAARMRDLAAWAKKNEAEIRDHDATLAEKYKPPTEPSVPAERLSSASVRVLKSERCILYTDVPASDEVDRLPTLVDTAFPFYCQFFQVDAALFKRWRVVVCLMKDRPKFEALDLCGTDLPNFKNGYTLHDHCWLYDQSSPYYRRHLLLHEAAHAFMYTIRPRPAPPWYNEGIAELLATHQLQETGFVGAWFPDLSESVPMLGRIELIKKGLVSGAPLSWESVMEFGPRAHLQLEPYAWSWAAAAFLHGHPRYQDRFKLLVSQPRMDVEASLKKLYREDQAILTEDWQVFIQDLEYGYDFARSSIEPTNPAAAANKLDQAIPVKADHGWQPLGIIVKSGETYRVTARGECVLSQKPRPWRCEPQGVTLRYCQGRPLGELQLAIRYPLKKSEDRSGFLRPVSLGREGTLSPEHDGLLYARINDFAGERADNLGGYEVTVSQIAAGQNEQAGK